MFLSPVFCEAFTSITGVKVELYNTDGSQGAARGAGVGAGVYKNFAEAFRGLKTVETIHPEDKKKAAYRDAYRNWMCLLEKVLEE